MKQSLKQSQKLSLKLTANLGNQIKLLSLSGFEISSKLNELIQNTTDINTANIDAMISGTAKDTFGDTDIIEGVTKVSGTSSSDVFCSILYICSSVKSSFAQVQWLLLVALFLSYRFKTHHQRERCILDDRALSWIMRA